MEIGSFLKTHQSLTSVEFLDSETKVKLFIIHSKMAQ
jgi:hypothetical protein